MINLINHSSLPMPKKWIQDWMTSLFQEIPRHLTPTEKKELRKELTIVFLNRAAAKKINSDLRDKDYATDILSFEASEADELGELVLCPQVLKAQAKQHSHSFRAELGYMLIHGVLHLLGYDHEKSKGEAARMFEIQDQLFDRLGTKFDI